jgi:hypothetical protein
MGGVGQLEPGELLAEAFALQASRTAGFHGHAMVEEDGVDALQPLGALVDQLLRDRTFARRSSTCASGTRASGSRRSISSSRISRASRRSVFARRLVSRRGA